MSHKCLHCGTEFEGNFCPECGEKWEAERTCPHCGAVFPPNAKFCPECGEKWQEGKTCPHCGALLPADAKFCHLCGKQWSEERTCPHCGAVLPPNAKFCHQCGYSFATIDAGASSETREYNIGKREMKLYAVSLRVPPLLLALFSVLIFFFGLAPVAVMSGGELFGQEIPSESLGNVYHMLSGDVIPSLQWSCITLVVFGSLLLVLDVILFFGYLKGSSFRLPFHIVGYAFFLAVFVTSCVMLGIIGKEDGGIGMLSAGAAPILILVFSLLFLLIAAVMYGIRIDLQATRPGIGTAYEKYVAEREAQEEREEIAQYGGSGGGADEQ